jgi:hypothetical protein
MILITALVFFAGFFSTAAFADSFDSVPTNITFLNGLKDKGHLVCHVTKQKDRNVTSIQEIDLNIAAGKTDVSIISFSSSQGRIVKNFKKRDWILDESYDDYSNEVQYEALVNLTDDQQSFILIQFYDNHDEAHGVLETADNDFDLLCR